MTIWWNCKLCNKVTDEFESPKSQELCPKCRDKQEYNYSSCSGVFMPTSTSNKKYVTETEIGMHARLPLCPNCSDTAHVRENERTNSLYGTYVTYCCSKCEITWEGRLENKEI